MTSNTSFQPLLACKLSKPDHIFILKLKDFVLLFLLFIKFIGFFSDLDP